MNTWCCVVGLLALFVSCHADNQTEIHCFDATCGVPVEDIKKYLSGTDKCTDIDIGHIFTPCNENRTRDILYFYKPPAVCRGGKALPAPVTGIACSANCSAGTYLSTSPIQCDPCSAGKFSVGGGINFSPPWKRIPAQITTECASDRSVNCSSWTARGSYIDSGDNFYSSKAQSLLEIEFDLERAGFIEFEYKFDGRARYDELNFVVDGQAKLFVGKNTPYWTKAKIPLTAGFHLVRWFFNKMFGKSSGQGRAYLRTISITGLHPADISCSACAPGTFSDESASTCLPCPAKTFSSNYSSGVCTPCPAFQTSGIGASKCVPDLPCNTTDMAVHIGACVDGKQKVHYDWLQPITCNVDGKVDLPADELRECTAVACTKGYNLNNNTAAEDNQCIACASGKATTNSVCELCPAGKGVGARRWMIDAWTETSLKTKGFNTSCSYEGCADTSTGWRYGGSFIDSGSNEGSTVDSSFSVSVPHSFKNESIQVEFDYTMSCGDVGTALHVFWDNILVYTQNCDTCTPDKKNSYFTVTPDQFRKKFDTSTAVYEYLDHNLMSELKFNYHKTPDVQGCDVRAKIYTLVVYGGGVGGDAGGDECIDCPKGTQSANGECLFCPPGSKGDGGAAKCAPCESGIAPFRSSSSCLTCGTNQYASKSNTECEGNCIFTHFHDENRSLTDTYFIQNIEKSEAADFMGTRHQSDLNGNISFFFSLCESIGTRTENNHTCSYLYRHSSTPLAREDRDGYRPYASPPYVCAIDHNTTAVSFGSFPHFKELNKKEYPDSKGVQVKYLNGSECGSGQRETTVNFICDTNAKRIIKVTGEYADGCGVVIEWRSFSACPSCKATDYSQFTSDCIEGKQKTNYYWLAPKVCHAGVSLPFSSPFTCEPPRAVESSDYVVPAYVVAISVIGALIFIAGVVYFIYRLKRQHKELFMEYRKMQENYAPMEEMPDGATTDRASETQQTPADMKDMTEVALG